MKQFFLILIIFLSYSCAPSKKVAITNVSTPLPPGTTVEVMGQGQKIPDGAKYLGKVSIVDSGFTMKCSYDVVLANAQNQARSMGGNLLQITKHKEPTMMSTCHQLWCDVYKI